MICSSPGPVLQASGHLPEVWKGKTLRSAALSALKEKVPGILPGTLFFIPSPLSPALILELVPECAEDCYFLFYEKDAELAAISQPQFIRAFPTEAPKQEQFFWLVHDTEEEIRLLSEKIPWHRIRRTVFFPVSNSWMFHSQRYRQIENRWSEEVRVFWMNKSTAMGLGALWVRNVFRNFLENSQRWAQWPHWGTDPVLVVGAGTSLEEALLQIPLELKNRFRILAADTALPILAQANWPVDGAVCVEAQQANIKDFQNHAGKSLALFQDLSGHPGTPRVISGPVYPFLSRFYSVSLIDRVQDLSIPTLPPLGSVGVTAVALALKLTQGPVILSGLDFAYPSGKTHAREAPSLRERRRQTFRFSTVEIPGCWPQGTISSSNGYLTSRVMSGYAGNLQNILTKEKNRIIDLSQGLSLGLEKTTLSSFRNQLEKWPSLAPLDRKTPRWELDSRPFIQDEETRLRHFFTALETVNSGLSSVSQELLEAARKLDHLYFHFPDTQEMPRNDSGFLTRLLLGARWHHQRLFPRN